MTKQTPDEQQYSRKAEHQAEWQQDYAHGHAEPGNHQDRRGDNCTEMTYEEPSLRQKRSTVDPFPNTLKSHFLILPGWRFHWRRALCAARLIHECRSGAKCYTSARSKSWGVAMGRHTGPRLLDDPKLLRGSGCLMAAGLQTVVETYLRQRLGVPV